MNVQSIWIKHVFRLKIENSKSTSVHGTIRIFLLPIYDEKHQQYGFDEARTKAIEIDRFVTKCKLIEVIFNHCQLSNIFLAREKKNIPFFCRLVSPGSNRVVRKSSDSSLTISFDRTFPMQLDGNVLLVCHSKVIQFVFFCCCLLSFESTHTQQQQKKHTTHSKLNNRYILMNIILLLLM